MPVWAPPARLVPPSAATLVVYRAAVANFAGHEARLLALLTPDERARAARYLRPPDRTRFVVGRGGLRALLGPLLELPPPAVPLVTNAFGKPQLAAPAGIQFNVAHSGNWVLLALGARPVGIDVEEVQAGFDFAAVAAARFSAAEQEEIARAPDSRAAFYARWTRHEARAKAAGHGLADDAANDPSGDWMVHSFPAAPGYPAALAYPADWQPVVTFCAFGTAWLG